LNQLGGQLPNLPMSPPMKITIGGNDAIVVSPTNQHLHSPPPLVQNMQHQPLTRAPPHLSQKIQPHEHMPPMPPMLDHYGQPPGVRLPPGTIPRLQQDLPHPQDVQHPPPHMVGLPMSVIQQKPASPGRGKYRLLGMIPFLSLKNAYFLCDENTKPI